jgi:hypothetical protein
LFAKWQQINPCPAYNLEKKHSTNPKACVGISKDNNQNKRKGKDVTHYNEYHHGDRLSHRCLYFICANYQPKEPYQ